MTEEIKFSVIVSLFNWIQKSKTSTLKRSKFRKFLLTYCKPQDYFSAIRLILPSLDRERGSYGLKESVLATCLIDALGISKDSPDAQRLINWRKGGAKIGANAGNFALVAAEVLQSRQGMTSGGLTIKELNDLLDRLASSENRSEKSSILSTLIQKTNAQEMKWIIMIILKELKLGMSEKSIFHEFHPDAEDLFNVTCDLKLVCEKLRDRSQRHKRQDIEVGKAVRPQLAMRVADAAAAWKKLHGKDVIVECKFDGDRIQIHKNGTEIHYFSRNFLDHTEYAHAMSNLIVQNVLVDRCILDGEMLVWDTSLNRFAEFGSNQEIAKAAREGLDNHKQLCYIAFDILYAGDTSVIHQTLKERHELLRKVVKPLKGRLEFLVPDGGLNTHRPPGEPCWSLTAHNVDIIQKFFKETIENRDEGVVVKDLGSTWEPGDRSGKWMKLKPEYVRAGSDLDVLVIGGYYGSGRHGGEVAQFLVGLAERTGPDTHPRRFVSFCRVGTGLSDEELEAVVTKLKPYFRKNEHPKKGPPSFYQVTSHSKERPDVWIESPEKSVIFSITSDIRTIRSEVFAAPYSLRFPRIDRVRYDKPWHECLDVQSFIELVHSSNGTTQKQKENEGVQETKPSRGKSSKRAEKKNISIVPSHFVRTDVSDIKGKTSIFSDMMFYFVNVPPSSSLDSLHKMVVENGGTFSMNMNSAVTHSIAAESSGLKYQAAKRHGDVIHYSWILDCCSQKKLLPLQPKYFVFLSESTKKKLQEEIDEFSDSYYLDIDLSDIKQLLSNVDKSEDVKTVDYYIKKFCPEDKWSCFHSCCIYFYSCPHPLKLDQETLLGLVVRRLTLEVQMGGGKVSKNLGQATHFVVFSLPGDDVDFYSLMESFSVREKELLLRKRLHVVRSQWLEDSLEREKKLPEETYSLKPTGIEVSNSEEYKSDEDMEEATTSNRAERCDDSCSPVSKAKHRGRKDSMEVSTQSIVSNREGRGKRGRPAAKTAKKGIIAVKQARRPQTRRGKIPSKIAQNETEESLSSDKESDIDMTHRSTRMHEMNIKENPKKKQTRRGKNPESLGTRNMKNEVVEDAANEEWYGQNPKAEKIEKPEKLKMTRSESDQSEDNEKPEKRKFIEVGGSNSGHDSEKPAKLEVMLDPVQAMLMDMIPSLGTQKAEPSKESISEPEKRSLVFIEEETVPIDSNPVPVKKKKVSYKELANDLLKDW